MKKICMNCTHYFDGMAMLAINPNIKNKTFANVESFSPICLFGLTLGTTMGPFFNDDGKKTICPFWQHEAEALTIQNPENTTF